MVTQVGDFRRTSEQQLLNFFFFFVTPDPFGMWLGHRMTYQLGLIKMMGEYAPALRMTVRMPRTMREQRNRDSSARRVTRHAEPASVRGELRDTLSLHQCAESYETR